jgi:hypothetical protein
MAKEAAQRIPMRAGDGSGTVIHSTATEVGGHPSRRRPGCAQPRRQQGWGSESPVEFSPIASALMLAARSDVRTLALAAEEAQDLRGLAVGAAEPVWDVGVELGYLAGGEDEVPVAEDQAHAPAEDV